MKTFITSDWHIGEDRFDIMQRPFRSALSHVSHLIECHNSVVGKDDLVYVVGDVFYQKVNIEQWLPTLDEFNGKKILIRGNHDRVISDEQFSEYFEKVFPDGAGLPLQLGGIDCYVTHYPSLARSDRFNIVGHIHGAWKYQLNCLNVSVDAHHFYPVDAEQIPFFFRAICEFYDADVWCAYHEANSQFRGKRGKSTSYYDTN